MLEARILQLQSDVVVDVQHAKVQFVNAHSSGKVKVASDRDPKSTPSDIPKSGKTVAKGASDPKPSRWMEKLTNEKKNLKKWQHVQQKLQKNVKEKPAAKSKGSSSLPGTPHKTISTTAKKTMKKDLNKKKKDHAGIFATATSTAAAGTAAMSQKASKGNQKHPRNQVSREEPAEVEKLQKSLGQTVSQLTSLSNPERLQEDNGEIESGETQQNIRSYLEACVFAGHIEKAHRFLLSQHRLMKRRRPLNTDIYNIMIRVWAKKVSSTLLIYD